MTITRRFFLGGAAATVAIPVMGTGASAFELPDLRDSVAEFLPCWGQEVRQSQYPKLFAVIGKTYGGGEDTFRLPDLQNPIRPVRPGSPPYEMLPVIELNSVMFTGSSDRTGIPVGYILDMVGTPLI